MASELEKSRDSKSNRIVPEPSDHSHVSTHVLAPVPLLVQRRDAIRRPPLPQDDPRRDPQVHWQWHKVHETTGEQEWLNYSEFESAQIEQNFHEGKTHVRVHSGKEESTKGNLKELFFGDMVQYNPVSGKVRNIRRQGPDPMSQKISRWVRGFFRQLESGSIRHKSFIKYKKMLERRATERVTKQPVHSQFCANIVHHGLFLLMQMAAIILNTVVIGFDVEYNGIDASDGTQAVFKLIDHAFCVFFTAEIVLRFGASKKRPSFWKNVKGILKDRWLMFDFSLVLLMVMETWAMPIFLHVTQKDQSSAGLNQLSTLRILRLLRLSRVGRVASALKYFPETFMMVKSILAAIRAVCATLGMLVFLLYIFAIIFKARCEQTAIQHIFPSLMGSMWRLLVDGAFMYSLGDTVEEVFEVDVALAVLFMVFVFLSNLTVLNMLIGVICEVAKNVSAREKEINSEKALKHDLMEFLECFDMDDDKVISMQEFDLLLKNPDVRSMLQRHQVDVETVVALKKSLFTNKEAMAEAMAAARTHATSDFEAQLDESHWIEKTLTYDELVVVILRFRGGAGSQATMLDVTNLERNLSERIWRLEHATTQSIRQVTTSQSLASTCARSTLPTFMTAEGDSEPESESLAIKISGAHEQQAKKAGMLDTDVQQAKNAAVQDTKLAPMIPADNPWVKLKEELARQQSTFSAEINEQLKCLVAGQHEIGQFVRDSFASRLKDKDANERWPQPAKPSQAAIASNQSQVAAQDAIVDTSATGRNARSRVDLTMNLTLNDEWGSAQMHVSSYEMPKAAPKPIPLLT